MNKSFNNEKYIDFLCAEDNYDEEIPEFFRDQSADELADIGILLYDVANLVGVDLDQAIRDKMVINKKRTWKIDPVTRIARHVEEQS